MLLLDILKLVIGFVTLRAALVNCERPTSESFMIYLTYLSCHINDMAEPLTLALGLREDLILFIPI